MKQKIFYSLFLAFALASCNSDEEAIKKNPDYVEAGFGALNVTLSNVEANKTRAAGDILTGLATTEEKKIESVAFFVETRDAGDNVTSIGGYLSGNTPMSSNGLTASLQEQGGAGSGTYTASIKHPNTSDKWNKSKVIVIANYIENGLAPKFNALLAGGTLTTLDVLDDIQSEVLTDNPKTPLLMYGAANITDWVNQNGGVANTTFDMERMVSRIDIRNMAYVDGDEIKGFVLESAQFIKPRTSTNLIPESTTPTDVSATPFAAKTNPETFIVDTKTYQKIDLMYAYENANNEAATATAVQLNGKYKGASISKLVEFCKPNAANTRGDTIALARNHRYVININPTPDSLDLKWDIEVKEWNASDTIKVAQKYPAPEISYAADAWGATWDAGTKTIDISASTAATATLTFTASCENIPEVEVITKYDADASSVGGDNGLAALVTKGEIIKPYGSVGIKREFTINVPTQTTEKVPLDLYIRIYNSSNKANADTIKITSRPNYTDARYPASNAKPVLYNGKFWAPVNVGASSTTYSANQAGCGLLFQWGHNKGFVFGAQSNVVTGPVTYEMAEGTYKDRYIKVSDVNISWCTDLVESGCSLAWSPEVNNGPCPEGWRVPTKEEMEPIYLAHKASSLFSGNGLKITGDDKKNTLFYLLQDLFVWVLPTNLRVQLVCIGAQDLVTQKGRLIDSTPLHLEMRCSIRYPLVKLIQYAVSNNKIA